MKKVLIAILVVIVLGVVIYFLLPAGAKDYINYQTLQFRDEYTLSEIQTVQNAKVLNQDSLTYEDILQKNVSYEYWTYDAVLNTDASYSKTITAYGSNMTLTYGEAGDGGICQDSKLVMVFVLDNRGGYNLTVSVDGKQLSTEDRDRLLKKMCQLAK